MLRTAFERELRKLQDRLLALGSEVENNIVQVVQVLQRRDVAGAERLIAADREVNQKRIEIMNGALTLIATQQPMAGDMRLIASIIEISGELERINDYSKGIARISLMLGPDSMRDVITDLPQMAELTRAMFRRAMQAVGRLDAELALEVPKADDEVDALFKEIYSDLVGYIHEHPEALENASYLEWAAHNLERSADRVINICEWVVYAANGYYSELDSELEAPPPQQVMT
jgi:phosphate transport system protein